MDRRALTRLAANAGWLMLSMPDALRFHRALHRDVDEAQRQVLQRIVRRNATTEFGRRHEFESVRSVDDFRARVPLSTYEDYADAIDRIGAGQENVLTSSVVRLLEPTSGSTAPTKYVPYTQELQRQVQRAIAPWIVDLFRRHPRLARGQAYWSISPLAEPERRTAAGIPIGFEDDAGYLGRRQRRLVQSILAVPSDVRHIANVEAFRYTTLLFLLRSRNLALISVWNPTFLVLLAEPLVSWWHQLVRDVEHGTLTPPAPLPPALQHRLLAHMPPAAGRADELRAAFAAHADDPARLHARLWPNLGLISCWTSAAAAASVPRLHAHFPHAPIQPKGLIATEGIVTIPIGSVPRHVLAVQSHFFEFLDSAGHARLASEVRDGETYEVVLTTDVLYRYRLHDLVRLTGRVGSAPALEFLGKTDLVADHFGEKLNERHVRDAIASATACAQPPPRFAMLALERTVAGGPAYGLFLEWPEQPDSMLTNAANAVEAALSENFHYAYCRRLGQLGPVVALRVRSAGLETFVAASVERGQRLGDVKPAALHRATDWSRVFGARPCRLS